MTYHDDHILNSQFQALNPFMIVSFVFEAKVDNMLEPILFLLCCFVILLSAIELFIDYLKFLLMYLWFFVVGVQLKNTITQILQYFLFLLNLKSKSIVLIN